MATVVIAPPKAATLPYGNNNLPWIVTYEYAIRLIKEGKAYCDTSSQEQMRAERMDGITSQCCDLSVEENLRRFKEMKNATEFGQTCCLRAKI
ncbi:hypothetical protein BGZ65_009131 [Modicella reniformis]|uniref:Glutamyl/glutaminyl-tRNA synthetase class Ib catalytic domain-containing protein n=1 Tax=Modicella reniformis TaxID=1440133 RepID=A0A9P6LRQ4_9FUNG|nr:hypothetical protein BGZ65_009131 [Modicella reniformis]